MIEILNWINNKRNTIARMTAKLTQYIRRNETVAQRLAIYRGDKHRSDMVFFIVSEDLEIPAHKFIVSLGSKTLEKFIYGSGDIKGSDRIQVDNISSAAFMEIISYLYTDSATITCSNALPISHVAHYYELADLETMCSEFLIKSLCEDNVCELYEGSHTLNNSLSKKCIEFIKQKTDTILKTLLRMDINVLSEILKLDTLATGEVDLFRGMIIMAETTCEERGLEITSQNRRAIIEEHIKFVRFPAMSPNEFSDCIKLDPTFFTKIEIADIMTSISLERNTTIYSNVARTVSTPADAKAFKKRKMEMEYDADSVSYYSEDDDVNSDNLCNYDYDASDYDSDY